MKEKGNAALAAENFAEAVKCYTHAISLDPQNYVLYSNRSAAHAKAGNYEASLEDANQTIKINPTWSRGYSRKGSALAFIGRMEEAIEAYKEGLKLDPGNQQLAASLEQVMDQVTKRKEHLFAKLRANPETKEWLNDPEYVQMVEVRQH